MPDREDADASASHGDGLEVFLRRWVETSGRALELRVARAARAATAERVAASFLYQDPTEGKPREGDVAATFSWGDGQTQKVGEITLVMECKSSTAGGKSTAWVGFIDQSLQPLVERTRAYVKYTGPGDAFTGAPETVDALAWQLGLYVTGAICSHIAAAKDGADKNNSTNPANAGLLQAVSAAHGYLDAEAAAVHVTVTAVVVSDDLPLYTCALDSASEIRFEQVPAMRVRSGEQLVWVVTESELPRLLEHIRDIAARAGKQARIVRLTREEEKEWE